MGSAALVAQTPQELAAAKMRLGQRLPERTCYDLISYHLTIALDPKGKQIQEAEGRIGMTILDTTERLQIDLDQRLRFRGMSIWVNAPEGEAFSSNRKEWHQGDQIFIDFKELLLPSDRVEVVIRYDGQPQEAVQPPWDGGFVWETDSLGRPWIGVACQDEGGYLWWPTKNVWWDKIENLRVSVRIPDSLGVSAKSNGQLFRTRHYESKGQPAVTEWEWKTTYPISNYNVTLNIGAYEEITDWYVSLDGDSLDLHYWVLDYNVAKAKAHFQQTKGMLLAFELLYGKYPFWNDGYSLVETPYWGMEHQGAIAYGNNYKNNPFGFDFILIHESGHEYWGNHLTAADPGDLWIHEAFTTYTETLYLELIHGQEIAREYLLHQRDLIQGTEPIAGPIDEAYDGFETADMYYKGAWMLHTLRAMVADDKRFLGTLRSAMTDLEGRPLTSDILVDYLSQKLEMNLVPFFQTYLYQTELPVLQLHLGNKFKDKIIISYRWGDPAWARARYPVDVVIGGKRQRLEPTDEWQDLWMTVEEWREFSLDTDHFYLETQLVN